MIIGKKKQDKIDLIQKENNLVLIGRKTITCKESHKIEHQQLTLTNIQKRLYLMYIFCIF